MAAAAVVSRATDQNLHYHLCRVAIPDGIHQTGDADVCRTDLVPVGQSGFAGWNWLAVVPRHQTALVTRQLPDPDVVSTVSQEDRRLLGSNPSE